MSFIPKGNVNFDDKIYEVTQWLIEFENGKKYPNREIGLDVFLKPIMIMPWNRNYGYWVDNNLAQEDFKATFKATEITEEEFETYWQQFLKENDSY